MNFFSGMTIKQRLASGFGVLLLLMVILTTIGVRDVNTINDTLTQITDINSVKQRYAINFRGSVHDRAIAIRDVALGRNWDEVVLVEQEIQSLAAFYEESDQKMQGMLSSGQYFSPEERRILKKIASIESKTLPLIKDIIEAKKTGQIERAETLLLDSARQQFVDWLAAINEFIDYQEAANQQATPIARDVAGSFETLMIIATAIAIVIGGVVALFIERSLTCSLGGEPSYAADILSHIAEGDLNVSVDTDHPHSMVCAMSRMADKLSVTVANIIAASDELGSQTTIVSKGSSQLLNAAREQSDLIAQTATNLDSMRSNVNQVAEIATHTEENSSRSADSAKQGRETINASAKGMQRIADTVSSAVEQIRSLQDLTQKIGGFANVISGISEQTNLLALNAAIEAARAGETGRGFAVVADEVRQLAQRTGEATAEIDKMITEIQNETAASVAAMERTLPQVESGKAMTEEAAQLLHDIERQAIDSLDNVKEVARASALQVTSITDIADTMETVTGMSNDSMVSLESNTDAVASLDALSNKLKNYVGYFKVKR